MDFFTGFDQTYDNGFYSDDIEVNDCNTDYSNDNFDITNDLQLVNDYDNTGFDYIVYRNGNALQLLNYNDPLLHSHEYHSGWFSLDENCPECREIINDIENGNNQWGRKLVHVDSYFRDDGTFVKGHFRTAPDSTESNNFSK